MTTPTAGELADLAQAVAQQRDRAAFATLFDYFVPRLRAYLLRLGASAGNADEITQDVMLVLWQKAGLFDPARSGLRTWLYRVARNRRIDMLRRDRVDYHDPADLVLDVMDTSIASADAQIDMHNSEALLQAAISKLAVEQVTLIRLAFYDGLSHSQIAQNTGLPLGTVKSRIRLAFSHLRRQLEKDGVIEAV